MSRRRLIDNGREKPRFSIPPALVRTLFLLLAMATAGVGALSCGGEGEGPDADSTAPMPDPPKKNDEFYVKAVEDSVHKGIDCAKCHASSDGPKGAAIKKSCDGCHEKQAKAHNESVHGKSLERGEKGAATCWDCHGSHNIAKVDDPRSSVYKLNLPYTCAHCHANRDLAKQHDIKQPLAANQFLESTHGRALLDDGLIVAPSCTNCHGRGHEIYESKDARSPISHDNIPKTCGKCHIGVEKTFERSVHFKLLEKGDKKGPVCSDCHSAHQIDKAQNAGMKFQADKRCGKCHEDRLHRYRETYHGRAIALGEGSVAACYDCHGHHDILPASDPSSTLAPGNLVKTCRKCHHNATANFAGYQTHGDHGDRKNYPILYWTYVSMTGLLLSVSIFFLIHTVLWFGRGFALYLRDPEAFKREKQKLVTEEEGKVYVRFRPVDRFVHFLVILSFLLLATTGMPLKFYEAPWAKVMFRYMGGANVAAGLHRVGAIITLTYFTVHVASLVNAIRRQNYRDEKGVFRFRRVIEVVFGPDSPMPNPQDLKDFVAHQKWFFGRGPRPDFDRWTYWEKFDWLAVFWGMFAIGFSGLIMWMPQVATRVLPGWAINVAHIIHSDEAMLATGFIFTFHFFNVHFRIEKFPFDPVIFSGRITEAEMLHERKRQYDRLKAAGTLDDERLGDEWARWRKIFAPIGMTAFMIGVVLIIAIYWVMAKRLMHD